MLCKFLDQQLTQLIKNIHYGMFLIIIMIQELQLLIRWKIDPYHNKNLALSSCNEGAIFVFNILGFFRLKKAVPLHYQIKQNVI